jgi:pectate lyase
MIHIKSCQNSESSPPSRSCPRKAYFIIFASVGIIILNLACIPKASAVAFAGAQGWGANATGGTTKYTVTNLNDSGTGSLRDAVSASGRDVVFSVSGTITLKSEMAISSNTTIDGTTAPSPGITVVGFSSSFSNQSNIIIRNMRFRETDTGDEHKCSLQGDSCSNVIIDHCSIEQGRWDCLEITGASSNVTVQFCMIGEGYDPQNFGFLVDQCNGISTHHNLFVDNQSRNPKEEGNGQYICNTVYNWGNGGGLIGAHSAAVWKSDIINNTFIAGPSSTATFIADCTSTDTWYQSDNYVDTNKNGNPWDGAVAPASDFTAQGVTLVSSPQSDPPVAVTIDSTAHSYDEATGGYYGCQPNDATDQRLVGYVKSGGTEGQIGPP